MYTRKSIHYILLPDKESRVHYFCNTQCLSSIPSRHLKDFISINSNVLSSNMKSVNLSVIKANHRNSLSKSQVHEGISNFLIAFVISRSIPFILLSICDS